MKISKCMQDNINFYRYVSIKLIDLIIDINKKIIEDELIGTEDSSIGITLGSLLVLKMAANDSFIACIGENCNSNDIKVYDVVVQFIDDRLKPGLDKDNKVAYDFAIALLHDIAKEGGFLNE